MSPEDQGKAWAKQFETLPLIDQLTTLYNLQNDNNNVEVKFQILSLLSAKAMQFLEWVNKEEDKVLKLISTKEGVKALTCSAVHPTLGVKCGLPASHTTKSPTTTHQNVNVHW